MEYITKNNLNAPVFKLMHTICRCWNSRLLRVRIYDQGFLITAPNVSVFNQVGFLKYESLFLKSFISINRRSFVRLLSDSLLPPHLAGQKSLFHICFWSIINSPLCPNENKNWPLGHYFLKNSPFRHAQVHKSQLFGLIWTHFLQIKCSRCGPLWTFLIRSWHFSR